VGLVGQLADLPPQRMAGWDPLLDQHGGEQGSAALLLTSHHGMGGCVQRRTGFSEKS